MLLKKKLLALNLYVRGNWRVKNMLVAEAAQRLRAASALAAETGMSRRVDEQLARATAATLAAGVTATAAGTVPDTFRKRPRSDSD